MDQWVQKLSIIIVLLTAAGTLYSSRLGAKCWCPAHFTQSHVDYTNMWCSSNASTHYPVPPPEASTSPDTAASSPPQMTELLGQNTCLLKFLAGEFILVCGLFSLIKCIVSCTSFDVLFSYDLHKTYSKAPAYIIVQLAGSLVWVLFAVLTHREYSQFMMAKPQPPFLCDFDIKLIGQVQKFTVQCADASEAGMKMAIMTNMGLCVVVVFSKMVHLVAVFGIQPLLKVEKVAVKMVDRKVIKESSEMSLGFGLSDLYFAILVSERDITPYVTIKQLQEDRRSEKPPYGSRPPSMIC